MNKNIIPSLDDTFKLTEQEFIIKYKVYNIIIFPDSNLEKEKVFQNNKNDVNGYIVDKNTFDEWVDKNKCIEYFNNFFDEERYKNHNPKTNETEETEEELFNFNKYYNQYLLDRDRKEEERINNLCDNIESIEENSNIIMLSGLAGSGKNNGIYQEQVMKKEQKQYMIQITKF